MTTDLFGDPVRPGARTDAERKRELRRERDRPALAVSRWLLEMRPGEAHKRPRHRHSPEVAGVQPLGGQAMIFYVFSVVFMLAGLALAGFETHVHLKTAQADDFGSPRLSPRFVFRMRIAAVLIGIGGAIALILYALEHFT